MDCIYVHTSLTTYLDTFKDPSSHVFHTIISHLITSPQLDDKCVRQNTTKMFSSLILIINIKSCQPPDLVGVAQYYYFGGAHHAPSGRTHND